MHVDTDEISHIYVEVRGSRFHVAHCGKGYPLMLLHGWPEFWMCWLPLMKRLQGRFSLYAVDLRGFGETGRDPSAPPDNTVSADVHAQDVLAIIEKLDLPKVGLVGHDTGAYVMQRIAQLEPSRLSGLFFFNCPTPGIGERWADANQLGEIWYQYFHQVPIAADFVTTSRETCTAYISWFLRHWSANPAVFDSLLDIYVDNFLRPGNMQGGFDWYLSSDEERRKVIEGQIKPEPISVSTRVLWGADDPLMKPEWMDCLSETFTTLDASQARKCGHFVHVEDPDLASQEISKFFDKVIA